MVANNPSSNQARFSPGQIVATPGALRALEEAGQTPMEFLARHVRGDWGELGAADQRANDQACAHEGDLERQDRILSSYKLRHGGKVWVITEWDRSVTTLLLPEDY